MSLEPQPPPPSVYVLTNQMPYIWAALIIVLIAALFVLAILALRPELDPLILISAVGGVGGTIFTSIAAYLKGGQVHTAMNGQLAAWKIAAADAAHSLGVQDGIASEQARMMEQLRQGYCERAPGISVRLAPFPTAPAPEAPAPTAPPSPLEPK